MANTFIKKINGYFFPINAVSNSLIQKKVYIDSSLIQKKGIEI